MPSIAARDACIGAAVRERPRWVGVLLGTILTTVVVGGALSPGVESAARGTPDQPGPGLSNSR